MEFRNLPVEIIIHITRYLGGFDIVRLSNLSRHFHAVFNYDTFWSSLLRRDGLPEDQLLSKIAEKEAVETNIMKLKYIFHKKADSNWKSGLYCVTHKECSDCPESVVVGVDDNYFVVLMRNHSFVGMIQNQMSYLTGGRVSGHRTPEINYSVNIYDLSNPGLQSPIHEGLQLFQCISLKQFMFYSHITKIFVWKNILIIVFGCTNKLNKLMALDINDGLKEMWADLDYEYARETPSNVLDVPISEDIELFSGKLFRINFSQRRIEIRNIASHQLENTLSIWQNFEFNGEDVASDGAYFVMTGKLNDRNAPCLVGWDIETSTNKLYVSEQPLCPYRLFLKTASSEGKVYGLLDRRALYIWNANTCEVLNTVMLSDGRPGQQLIYSNIFLAMSKDATPPFLVTINKNFQMLTILDRLGNTSQEIGWSQLRCPCPDDSTVVLDVHISKSFMLVQFMKYSTNVTFFILFPLPLGRTTSETVAGSKYIGPSFPVVEGQPRNNQFGGLRSDALVKLTPNKLLHFSPNFGLHVFEFLFPKLDEGTT